MVSRARIAAAACLVTSGLFIGGASGALAFAGPTVDGVGLDDGDGTTAEQTQNVDDAKPGEKPDGEKPDGEKPDDGGEKPDGEKPDDGGEKPDDEKPDGEKPDGERPDGEEPGEGEGEDGEQPTKDPDPTATTEPPPPPEEEPEPGRCEDKGDDDCGPGWPWWPWPDPGTPPEPGDGGVGGGHADVPSGRPGELPPMQIPSHMLPPETEPTIVDAEPGVGVAASEVPLAPITLPVIVAPPVGFGAGAPRSLPGESLAGSPRGNAAEPPAGRQPPPGQTGSNASVPPSSYRVGYTDYLRTAGISQVVALAAPGLAGMLVLTGAGGLVGYRQAKAGHAVRAGTTARFVN